MMAQSAEKLKHHPDFTCSYTNIDVTCTTHDVRALTIKDLQLALAVEYAYKAAVEGKQLEEYREEYEKFTA